MDKSAKTSFVDVNGIKMHVAEMGEGPLVVFCHGWPELGYSWRHQIRAAAAAGFRAAAPDMRGFGKTSAPDDIAAYTILHNVGDMVALVRALGEKTAIIVGHDWGAPVAWNAALLRPDIFRAVVGMSVPFAGRPPAPPVKTLREAGQTNFYWVYFQTPGLAEAEFERDVAATMGKLLTAGAGDDATRALSMTLQPGKGLLDNAVLPNRLPDWLTQADLDVFVGEYRRTGYRGGLNWYRNIDRNFELMAPWQDAVIGQPSLFIAGTRDGVITGPIGKRALERMPSMLPNLKGTVLLDGAGHWVQQERAEEVNAALIKFLKACG
jgi:pimeloyl-ACP methyl ester carboxylesterase